MAHLMNLTMHGQPVTGMSYTAMMSVAPCVPAASQK
jgi:hypothetical protein